VKEKQFIGGTLDNWPVVVGSKSRGRVSYAKTMPVKFVGKLGSWLKK
jgi:hypothetical protein